MRGLPLMVTLLLWGPPVAYGKSADKPAPDKAAPDKPAKPAAETAAKPAGGKGYADVNALFAAFSKSPGLSAHFREEKKLAMLDKPLVNEGTIHFAPPGRLARHTTRPVESTLLIDGSKLQFGDAEGQQSVDLAANPVARLFVDSFVKLLAGDRAGLEKIFTMKFTPGSAEAWRLVLVPQVAPMDKVIKELDLHGAGLIVHDVDVRETSGDVTHTTFSDVDVNHHYDAAEAARVFRLPKR